MFTFIKEFFKQKKNITMIKWCVYALQRKKRESGNVLFQVLINSFDFFYIIHLFSCFFVLFLLCLFKMRIKQNKTEKKSKKKFTFVNDSFDHLIFFLFLFWYSLNFSFSLFLVRKRKKKKNKIVLFVQTIYCSVVYLLINFIWYAWAWIIIIPHFCYFC